MFRRLKKPAVMYAICGHLQTKHDWVLNYLPSILPHSVPYMMGFVPRMDITFGIY